MSQFWSPFDEQFGYYAQGVEAGTAVLPRGWEDRLITWQSQSTRPAQARFLDPHDLALAKLAAFRDKDRAQPSLRNATPMRAPSSRKAARSALSTRGVRRGVHTRRERSGGKPAEDIGHLLSGSGLSGIRHNGRS